MRRILFVDDETRILDGLRRSLHERRGAWEMVFAEGATNALSELGRAPFDVIVSDMRMPGMDGGALLKQVQEQYPSTIRIILSGYSEVEATMRVVPVAHQFLSKPCSAEILTEVIERASSLQVLLANDDIRSIVTGMSTLPAQPRMYQEITAALSKPDVGIGAVADILEHDVAMCANILHLVNSAFFAAPRRLPDIESAVTFLGTTMLKQLVLSVEAFRTWETIGVSGLDLEALTQHGFLTANLARRLLSNKRDAEDAFMAAMLHDIGKLVLATACPEQMAAVSAVSTTDGRPLEVVERERLGVSHGPVGAYLLGLWGIPHPIVEAVARHDSPMNVPQQSFGILGAVYVADHLINEQSSPSTGPVSEVQEPLDTAYLERLGVAGRIPEWRLLAQDLTSMNEAI